MKKSVLLYFATLLAFDLFAQVPQGINFQAVARDNTGNPKPSQMVSVFFNIKDVNNNSIYQEIQTATTDACGMFNLKIGTGNGVPIAFNQVDWSSGAKILEVKIDGVLIGNQEMVSVPYALYAEKTKIAAGNGISVVGNTVTNTAPDQPVTIIGSGATTVAGTYPNFTVNSPNAPTYSAGNGIGISGTNISNTGDLSNTNELQTLSIEGNNLTISNGNTVLLPINTYTAGTGINITNNVIAAQNTNPIWNSNQLQGSNVSNQLPQVNQVLQWNGSAWIPTTINLQSGSNSQTLIYTADGF